MPIHFQLDPHEQSVPKARNFFIQENVFEIIVCKCTSFCSGLNVLIFLIVARDVLEALVIEGDQ